MIIASPKAKVARRPVERRSAKSRAIRAVRRIINERGMSMEIEELTALGLFLIAMRSVKF